MQKTEINSGYKNTKVIAGQIERLEMKKKLFDMMKKYSIRIKLPMHLILLYLPGFVFSAFLIQLPCGPIGYLGLFFVELWEIKKLDELDNIVSKVFIPTIVFHPLLFSFLHIISWLILKVNPTSTLPFSDEILTRLRVGYVIYAYVLIISDKVHRLIR